MSVSPRRDPIRAKRQVLFAVYSAVILTMLLSGCGQTQLLSRARDTDIVIDGRLTEWEGKLDYLDKAKLYVGLANDDLYVYAALVVRDRQVSRQLMMTGFTLWFNDLGNKDKKVGIRFPNRTQNLDPQTMMGGDLRKRGQHQGEAPDTMMIQEFIRTSVEGMNIMSTRNWQYHQLHVSAVGGVESMVDVVNGVLVYEFKMPLVVGQMTPVAVGTERRDAIGLGIESPEIKMPRMDGSSGGRGGSMPGGGRPSGGMGGRGGGGRSGGMGGQGGPRGDRPEMPKPLDLWAVALLADTRQSVR